MFWAQLKAACRAIIKAPPIFYSLVAGAVYSWAYRKESKCSWIYAAWAGQRYSDNPRYLLAYASSYVRDREHIWITKNRKLARYLRALGVESYHYLSHKGLKHQATSEVAFVTHSAHFDACATALVNTPIVNLWHGTPIKKILADSADLSSLRRFISYIAPQVTKKADYLVTQPGYSARVLSGAFRLDSPVLINAVSPRHAHYLQRRALQVEKCRLLYMPTFRGSSGSEFPFLKEDYFPSVLVDNFLHTNDLKLNVRLHPVNTSPVRFDSSRIYVENKSDEDFSDVLCVITDFSSVFIDMLYLDIPVVFYAPDAPEYISNERELYVDFDRDIFLPICTTWADVLKMVEEIESSDYRRKYEMLKLKFTDNLKLEEDEDCSIACLVEKVRALI